VGKGKKRWAIQEVPAMKPPFDSKGERSNQTRKVRGGEKGEALNLTVRVARKELEWDPKKKKGEYRGTHEKKGDRSQVVQKKGDTKEGAKMA